VNEHILRTLAHIHLLEVRAFRKVTHSGAQRAVTELSEALRSIEPENIRRYCLTWAEERFTSELSNGEGQHEVP
jgi:hypothetical protein